MQVLHTQVCTATFPRRENVPTQIFTQQDDACCLHKGTNSWRLLSQLCSFWAGLRRSHIHLAPNLLLQHRRLQQVLLGGFVLFCHLRPAAAVHSDPSACMQVLTPGATPPAPFCMHSDTSARGKTLYSMNSYGSWPDPGGSAQMNAHDMPQLINVASWPTEDRSDAVSRCCSSSLSFLSVLTNMQEQQQAIDRVEACMCLGRLVYCCVSR